MQNKMSNEVLFKSSADKRLTTQYKSYTDMYKAKIAELDSMIKELKGQQKQVKESAEQNSKQVIMFTNLKRLLELKLKSIAKGPVDAPAEPGSEEYNRLVLS